MSKLKLATCLTAMLMLASTTATWAQGTLRIGMTASDIPLTTGQTDNGGEGQRFLGFTAYARPNHPIWSPALRSRGVWMRPTRPSGFSNCAMA
jgi:hypothetical protein